MGININDSEYPWTDYIMSGKKTIETRNTPTLRPYIGKRVGIIQTGKGKAKLIGYMTIEKEIEYDKESWAKDKSKHLVDSELGDGEKKYGYVIGKVEKITPQEINSKGIVARKINENLQAMAN